MPHPSEGWQPPAQEEPPVWTKSDSAIKGRFPGISEDDATILTSRREVLPSIQQYAAKGNGGHIFYAAMMDIRDMIRQYDMDAKYIVQENRTVRHDRFKQEKDTKWYGFTRLQTEQALAKGWPLGATRISQMVSKLKQLPDPVSARLKVHYAQDGEEISVDHYLDAQYDRMWRRYHRDAGIGPRVMQVSFSWGGNCHLRADQLFWTGAAAAVLTDLLEQAGYAVELRAWTVSNCYHGEALTGVTIKESDQPLQMDLLAALSAHSGAFRYHGIQSTELAPFAVGGGHGSHHHGLKGWLDVLANETGWFERPEIVVDSCYDERAAHAVLEELITHINQKALYA